MSPVVLSLSKATIVSSLHLYNPQVLSLPESSLLWWRAVYSDVVRLWGEAPLTWSLAASVTPSLLPGTVCAGLWLGTFAVLGAEGGPGTWQRGPTWVWLLKQQGYYDERNGATTETHSPAPKRCNGQAIKWPPLFRLDLPFFFCEEEQKRFLKHLCWSLSLTFSHHPQQGRALPIFQSASHHYSLLRLSKRVSSAAVNFIVSHTYHSGAQGLILCLWFLKYNPREAKVNQ